MVARTSTTRSRTWRRVVAAAVSAVALALTGPAAATTGSVTLGAAPMSKPDLRILQTALGSLDGSSTHRLRIDGTMGIKFRQSRSRLGVSFSDDFAALIQAASPTRATLSVADGLFGPLLSAIVYDGDGYVGALDTPYAKLVPSEADALAEVMEPARQRIRPSDLTYLFDVERVPTYGADAGLVHFTADLDGAYTRDIFQALIVGPDLASRNSAESFTFPTGSIDVFITPSGELVRESVSVKAKFDSVAAGGTLNVVGFPIGSATVSFSATFTPSDVGLPVQIVRPFMPTPDPGMDEDIQAILLLLAGSDAANSYAKAVGDYSGLTIGALRRIEPSITWIRGRPARSARSEVRLQSVNRRRVVMSTRTPGLRTFVLDQPLRGDPVITCRDRRGRLCDASVFARIATRAAVRTTSKLNRRLHARRVQRP